MKDPAVLVYFDKWTASTNGMSAAFRAWYFDLMLYQYDKGPIPDNLDTMAGICRVLPSEYDLFNQMVNQVVKRKFKETPFGLVNEVTEEIIEKRRNFRDKRKLSSNIGVIVKMAKTLPSMTSEKIDLVKKFLFKKSLDEILQYKDIDKIDHLVNHLVNLYIDVDVDVNNNTITIKKELKEKNFISKDDPFLKNICKTFDQNGEILEMRVWSFLNSLKNQNKLDIFKTQTLAYIEFKKISKEKIHRWQSYCSEWPLEDWSSKLLKLKPINNHEEKNSQEYD